MAESLRNKNNVGIANMKQVTVTDQCILDHQVKHRLSQVLMNQTQDIRPRAKGQEKKEKQQTRSAKKWRRGREQFLPVNLGSCWEDSGCSLLWFRLLLRSRIFLSFLFFPFNLSSFLCSSAFFFYCRFPVLPSLPFFGSFLECVSRIVSSSSSVDWSGPSLSSLSHLSVSFFYFCFFIFLFFNK